MNTTIELTEEQYTALWYFLGIAASTLEDRHPQTKEQMHDLLAALQKQGSRRR
jgi:hypothetical protein